jgi:hypothetical protein
VRPFPGVCPRCNGAGYLRVTDDDVHGASFGALRPCTCGAAAIAFREQIAAAKVLIAIDHERYPRPEIPVRGLSEMRAVIKRIAGEKAMERGWRA